MTTIVANTNRMVADTQGTLGNMPYYRRKIYRVRGALVAAAGYTAHSMAFLRWYGEGCRRGCEPSVNRDDGFGAFVLDKSGLWEYDDDMVAMPIYEDVWAIGSGRDYALTALRLGKTPEEAVEIACKMDVNSGLPLQVEVL